jgi:hypothetical protein
MAGRAAHARIKRGRACSKHNSPISAGGKGPASQRQPHQQGTTAAKRVASMAGAHRLARFELDLLQRSACGGPSSAQQAMPLPSLCGPASCCSNQTRLYWGWQCLGGRACTYPRKSRLRQANRCCFQGGYGEGVEGGDMHRINQVSMHYTLHYKTLMSTEPTQLIIRKHCQIHVPLAARAQQRASCPSPFAPLKVPGRQGLQAVE